MRAKHFYSKSEHCRSQRGLTLIELMIGTVLFLVISSGVYQFVRQFSKNTANTQTEVKAQKNVIQFKRLMQEEIENIVPLQNAKASFLSVARPADCVNTDEISEMSWSLLPFPGYNLTQYKNNDDFDDLFTNPVDPTIYANNATEEDAETLSDGMIFITVDRESPIIHMARDADGTLFLSEQANPLVLENRDGIDIGDYLLVSDSIKRDLFRVTDIAERGDGRGFNVTHSATSIWNIPFSYNFGYTINSNGTQLEIPGGAYIAKANVISYFFDQDTNTIQKDSHLLDDGFNPSTKTFDIAGLAHAFNPILSNVAQMKINYRVIDPLNLNPGGTASTIMTRTPRPGIYGKKYTRCAINPDPFCDCQNQIGFSDMKKIELNITMLPDPSNPDASGQRLDNHLAFIPKKLVDPPFGSSASLLLTKPTSVGGDVIIGTMPQSDVPVGGGSGGSGGNSGPKGGGGGA